jgi:uncharacterized membrane protein YhaH (DUF805 family)
MLGAIFSFRGRLNRIQYFLGCCGAGAGLVVLLMLVGGLAFAAAGGGSGPPSMFTVAVVGLAMLLVVGPLYCWISFSLQARRFRDIGWEPVFVIPGWIGANIIDRLAVMGAPQIAIMPGAGISWLTVVVGLFFSGSLLFWPGHESSSDVASVFDDVPPPPGRAAPPAPAPAARRWSPSPAPAATGFGRRGL